MQPYETEKGVIMGQLTTLERDANVNLIINWLITSCNNQP